MEKKETVEQTKLAFDFIQRLYLETSYFIKEIEGTLKQEQEEFQILKPGGYGISTTRSIGLESAYVQQWLTSKAVVFFAPRSDTQLTGGVTTTKFSPDLRLIVVRVVLWDKDLDEPEVWAGILSDVVRKKEPAKFENYIGSFTYHDKIVFQNLGGSQYEDAQLAVKLDLIKKPLYEIGNSEDIRREIIDPVLRMYRSK